MLLDVGGTLIGPRRSFGEVYARVYGELGIELSAPAIDRAVRSTWAAQTRALPPGTDRFSVAEGGDDGYWLRFSIEAVRLAGGKVPTVDLAREALLRIRSAFAEPASWRVEDDVIPALEGLRRAGARLAVVSNWDRRLPRLLGVLGLDRYFETLGVSALEGREKPDPELFRAVLRRLGADPGQALHVGDVPELDLAGARAAEIDAVLIDRAGRAGPPALRTLRDLPRVAREGLPVA